MTHCPLPDEPRLSPIKRGERLNPGGEAGADDRDAEISRILGLGARRVDIGQTGNESWTVLADPEGNEFCILRPKRTLIG